jgi:hypothetical protein
MQKLKNNENEDKTNLLPLERSDWRNYENIRSTTAKKDVDLIRRNLEEVLRKLILCNRSRKKNQTKMKQTNNKTWTGSEHL